MMENDRQRYALCALLSRMKYITRWGLMRQSRPESLSEHSAEVAVLAHMLALIATEVYGEEGIRPETVAVAAIYHDASEILTGDMPTPVKYKNERLRSAYKALERESAESLAALGPPQLAGTLAPLITGDALNDAERKLLKAADRLSALIKCIEERKAGNSEFAAAERQQVALLRQMELPAANTFIEQMLPCYEETLDALAGRE